MPVACVSSQGREMDEQPAKPKAAAAKAARSPNGIDRYTLTHRRKRQNGLNRRISSECECFSDSWAAAATATRRNIFLLYAALSGRSTVPRVKIAAVVADLRPIVMTVSPMRQFQFKHSNWIQGAALGAAAGWCVADSPAQEASPAWKNPVAVAASSIVLQQPATKPAIESDGNDEALAPFRAPLLREGSYVVDVSAQAKRDTTDGLWRLVLDQNAKTATGAELILLPCTKLAEMQRIIESTPAGDVTFQVTARVFVYRGRNFILPVHAPVLAEQETVSSANSPASSAPDSSADGSQSNEAAPAAQAPASTGPEGGETAADIIGELERASDSPVRSAGAARETARKSSSTAAASERRQPGATAVAAPAPPGRLLHEDTAIVARRGKLFRDGAGGWLFVFDADASGLADPPMKLLPCLLLEKIEDYARQAGNNSPALLSGQVYLYNSQNYLLPTVFRIPQDRRNLTP
jgi:hypothetical protein